MQKKKKTFSFFNIGTGKKTFREFYFNNIFLIIILGLLVFALILFYLDADIKMYGNSADAVGQYVMAVATILGGSLVALGLWINNKRVLEQIRQNNIAEKAQINTRFKDAATLLGSENVSSILSGIYALHQIAVETYNGNDNQRGYVGIVHDILCAFIRENTQTVHNEEKGKDWRVNKKPTIVIQTILNVLFKNEKEIYSDLITDLSDCVFEDLYLDEANIVGIDFSRTKFIKSNFKQSNFHSCYLEEAFIDEVDFSMCSFKNVVFDDSFIRKSTFEDARFTTCDFWETQQTHVKYDKASFTAIDFKSSVLDQSVSFRSTSLEQYPLVEIVNNSVNLTQKAE